MIARAAAGLIVLSVAVYFAVTVFSFLGSSTWLGELTTHFRAQMALAGAVLVAVTIGLRARAGTLVGAFASLANFLPLLACFDGAVPAGRASRFGF